MRWQSAAAFREQEAGFRETTDVLHAPVSIYECHLGSWRFVQDAEGRWRPLTYREAAEALPGFKEPAVVRTFDAPEAMGINFHEVRARSALNHVPGSRYVSGR